MPRIPRCYADPAKQAETRAEIRAFGPVAYMVEILNKPTWLETHTTTNSDGEEKTATKDRTQEYATKLQWAAAMVHKLAPNLRHQTVDVQHENRRTLSEFSDAEIVDEITQRHNADDAGKGDSTAH